MLSASVLSPLLEENDKPIVNNDDKFVQGLASSSFVFMVRVPRLVFRNCLVHRLVRSIAVRRTSGLGIKPPISRN